MQGHDIPPPDKCGLPRLTLGNYNRLTAGGAAANDRLGSQTDDATPDDQRVRLSSPISTTIARRAGGKEFAREHPSSELEAEQSNYDSKKYQRGLLQSVFDHVLEIKQFGSEAIHAVVIEGLKTLGTGPGH
jgi:hypothetical protein